MLAVFDEKRFPDAPDVPTMREKGIDLISSSTRGYVFPAGTPMEIVKYMEESIRKAMDDPDHVKRMKEAGLTLKFMAVEDYAKFIESQNERAKELGSRLGGSRASPRPPGRGDAFLSTGGPPARHGMSIPDRIAWVALLFFGGFVIYESLQISYYGSDFGPGPGFFSFWLGVLVIGIAVLELARGIRRRGNAPLTVFPDRGGLLRMGCVLGALTAVVLLIDRLGYSLTIFLFASVLLRALGRRPWWLTLLLALAGGFGTGYVFRQLQVMLPGGILGM
jgi:hypothetical protein